MKALPPLTTQFSIALRQLNMPLDSRQLHGLRPNERAAVIARLAVLLMAAAGVATEEAGDDGR